MKPVCSFQRPLYTSVVYGRTIDQHTRDAYRHFGSDIPVICVSGRHDAAGVSRRMDVAACFPKPFDLDTVVARVREIVTS